MTSFSALLALCAGNSPVHGEFPAQSPVTRSFDFFYLRLNKRLSKQSSGWWFETPSWSLWRHCNEWNAKNTAMAAKNEYMIYRVWKLLNIVQEYHLNEVATNTTENRSFDEHVNILFHNDCYPFPLMETWNHRVASHSSSYHKSLSTKKQ